jgi:hypothetical protein
MKYLKQVAHVLTVNHKHQGVQSAKDLFKVFTAVHQDSWSYFMTNDENCFHLSTDSKTISLQQGEKRPMREMRIIRAEKVMFTIFWSPTGTHLIDELPRDGDSTPGTSAIYFI